MLSLISFCSPILSIEIVRRYSVSVRPPSFPSKPPAEQTMPKQEVNSSANNDNLQGKNINGNNEESNPGKKCTLASISISIFLLIFSPSYTIYSIGGEIEGIESVDRINHQC